LTLDAGYFDVIEDYYEPAETLFDDEDTFLMRAGFITRPEIWYIPRKR
jgi:hypothetical protein